MRLVVLAIASRGPVYDYFNAIFKAYMNTRPWIKSYLVFGDSDVFRVEGDEIHVPVKESWMPGILLKTVYAIRWIAENERFDFFMRTNLSSFWLLDKLYNVIGKLPREKVGFSHHVPPIIKEDIGIFNGSGMVFSRDVIDYLAKVQDWNLTEPDDREITRHAHWHFGARIVDYKYYHWYCPTPEDINVQQNIMRLELSGAVQVRIRNPYDNDLYKRPEMRMAIDPAIHLALYYHYYGFIPSLLPEERDLANFAIWYNVIVEEEISDGLKEFLLKNPYNKEGFSKLTISQSLPKDGICIKNGILCINKVHPLIPTSMVNKFLY